MENENYNRNIWYNILCKTEGDYLIIKHVYNGNITCAHYENEKTFIKQCRKPEFRDVLLNAKDVIVLENNGNNYGCKTLLEVYHRYNSYVLTWGEVKWTIW